MFFFTTFKLIWIDNNSLVLKLKTSFVTLRERLFQSQWFGLFFWYSIWFILRMLSSVVTRPEKIGMSNFRRVSWFQDFEQVGNIEEMACDQFSNEKRTGNESLGFRAISTNKLILSHEKYPIYMLFEAFHKNNRNWLILVCDTKCRLIFEITISVAVLWYHRLGFLLVHHVHHSPRNQKYD